jgi:hypothetical protein
MRSLTSSRNNKAEEKDTPSYPELIKYLNFWKKMSLLRGN